MAIASILTFTWSFTYESIGIFDRNWCNDNVSTAILCDAVNLGISDDGGLVATQNRISLILL